MDDPESEWEIKESSADGKLSWVLRLGRKLLVAGIVISSAPLVLPPIMAISAVGLVCSVPYGVLLVSYACTKTLMSRLLPMPSPPPPLLLEYGKPFDGEDELKEDGIEFVEKGNEGLDKGSILEKDAYLENCGENDGEESVEQVDETVEETGYEEDNRNEKPSESFEEVKGITRLNVEQPIVEGSQKQPPAGIEAVVQRGDKCGSNVQKETPLGSENVEEEKELVEEMRQSVEKKDARRKRRKKTKSKSEGTTKVEGEHSIKGSVNEQPGDKQKTSEMKNVAAGVENDELVGNSRGSLERNREEGTSLDAAEDRQGGEQEQVDVKLKISNGDEGTTRRKQEQPIIEESSAKQPVDDKIIGPLGGLDGSEKEDKEIPLDGKNVLVQLIQGIDVEENEKLTQEQPKEMEVLGTIEVNEEEYVRDGSMSEQPIEEICNIVVEFEGDEKSGRNMENEALLQKKKVDVHLSQSTDIVEDEELVRETRGLLEKIRDEGKKSEEMDVEKRAQSMGTVSKTVHDDSIAKGLTVESVTFIGEEVEDVNEDIVEPNYQMNKEKKDVVLSVVNEREIDEEQGGDLLEIASTVSLLGSPPEVITDESQPSSSYSVHQEASDSSDLPVSTKYEGAADIRISAENAIDAASNEAIQCEEKIWEQMNALRTIVGYEAAHKETCIEELKALYLFTGIDPPASLKDTCDLDEVDAKLGFLKSVVGVK
ncbi:hypothetical protein HRI_000014900 [Hibiscus trionum]|uniref:Uncharacterized protein n=1 Tax=Hibiscus trionum TaxID=183268 RepID=A0A9W7LGP4_HIBTR|nr:hypothetical protein HRI_000014900 [Hibiscus trionum]